MRALARMDHIDRAVEAIALDRVSGASELALRALRLLSRARPLRDAPAGDYRRDIRALARRIGRARPAMAPIRAVTERFLYGIAGGRAHDARAACRIACAAAAAIEHELLGTTPAVAKRFAGRFDRMRRPLVISYSSQVIAAIEATPRRRGRITVCESRPRFEGRRTARVLATHGRSVTVVTEAQIATAAGDCDCALLGSDAIFADGSVRNKSGSYLVALACRERSLPVIILGDRFKMSDKTPGGETHAPQEVWRSAPPGVRVQNEYFEHVPAGLIDYIILESGVYRPRNLRDLWEKERKIRA
ncbi:MAG: hypothetical protein ACE5EO_06495 [Candidatus Krumholzibacteriia bacterium]